jgi:hypothetical protein
MQIRSPMRMFADGFLVLKFLNPGRILIERAEGPVVG